MPPQLELSDPRAFDCKNHISAPESSRPEWLLPKDTSDANTQSPGAAYDDFSFHASSASTACGGIGNGRREESVFGGPSMPATYDRRTCKVERSKSKSAHLRPKISPRRESAPYEDQPSANSLNRLTNNQSVI